MQQSLIGAGSVCCLMLMCYSGPWIARAIDRNRSTPKDFEPNCVFCQISNENDDGVEDLERSLPRKILSSNSLAVAFKDRFPQGKEHYLVIPKQHIRNINSLKDNNVDDIKLLESMIKLGKEIVHEREIDAVLSFHVPPFTSVNHLHLHVIVPPITRFGKSKNSSFFAINAEELLLKLKSKL